MKLTRRFQFLLRSSVWQGSSAPLGGTHRKAERGSHIMLDEPLPQPAWELPLIANGEGTVTDSTYLGRVTYVDFWASWWGRADCPYRR